MPRRRALTAALTLALVAGAAPARAYVPEKTPRRAVEAVVRTTLAEAPVRASRPGLLVRRGRRDLFGVRADGSFLPASLMKLVTTAVAVERFGPNHRFTTRVHAAGAGATRNALYLVGGGDPTLSTAAYVRERFVPPPGDAHPVDPLPSGVPTIETLAARVAGSGIRRAARLVVDDSLFDAQRVAPGWRDRYLTSEPDTGLLSALTVNEGYADLKRRSILPDPALGAGDALKAALARRGVAVGTVVRGTVPKGAKKIATIDSPPVRELVFYINRWSVNYPADMLLKNLGASFGGEGSTARGVGVVVETLGALGVGLEEFQMADGSGLSLLNRIAPRTLAQILEHMLSAPGEKGRALRESLPVAAGPGTLSTRMSRWPVAGNLRGKTGYLSGVRGMAGWVRGADGVPLVYVAIFNDAASPFALTGPLDALGTALSLFPRR